MSIKYNPEEDSWELHEPTDAEKASLIEIANDYLANYFGQQVAHAFMAYAQTHKDVVDLEDIDPNQMGKPN